MNPTSETRLIKLNYFKSDKTVCNSLSSQQLITSNSIFKDLDIVKNTLKFSFEKEFIPFQLLCFKYFILQVFTMACRADTAATMKKKPTIYVYNKNPLSSSIWGHPITN